MRSNSIKVHCEEVESSELVQVEYEGSNEEIRLEFFPEALKEEFTNDQVKVLYKLALPVVDAKKQIYIRIIQKNNMTPKI